MLYATACAWCSQPLVFVVIERAAFGYYRVSNGYMLFAVWYITLGYSSDNRTGRVFILSVFLWYLSKICVRWVNCPLWSWQLVAVGLCGAVGCDVSGCAFPKTVL